MRNLLLKHIPENAVEFYRVWWEQYPHQLVITKPRKTKLGDYRPPHGRRGFHKITVNGDLNKYEFFVTLVHEVAHLITHVKYGRSVSPHGKEWKQKYSELLKETIKGNCFPNELINQINKHSNNPSASSCVDIELYKSLRKFSVGKSLLLVEDIEFGAKFILKGGKRFIKGQKLRKRFKCEEIETGKTYLVSPIAEVRLIA